MNTECRDQASPQGRVIRGVLVSLMAVFLLSTGCTRPPARTETAAPEPPSQIKVEVRPGGPIVLTTSAAEFQILPSGYIQAALLKGDQKLTLDQPGAGGSDVLVLDGKPVQFTLNLGAAKVEDSVGKLGRGKRVEIPAQAQDPSASNIQRTLQVEVYDAFPSLAALECGIQKRRHSRTFTSTASSSSSTNSMPAWRRRMRSLMTCGVIWEQATTGERTTW